MVLSTVLGTKDHEQVATMAKQAGEVSEMAHAYLLECFISTTFCIEPTTTYI